MTLFTELDPNPIIKLNSKGIIVGMNSSAKQKFNLDTTWTNSIEMIIGQFEFNLMEIIQQNKTLKVSSVIQNNYYEINVHGISLLDMAQLYFYDLTEKKVHLEQMNAYQKLLKESSAKALKDLEDERIKMASLLHDSIGQNLLLMRLGIQNLGKFLDSRESREELTNMSNIIDTTINETKDISRSIRPLNLDELGLSTVLASLCKNVSRESHLTYSLNIPEEKVQISKDLENCIYRVTQESLNNIIKHSRAKSFTVNLNIDSNLVTLIIADDGIGFSPLILLNEKYISDGLGIVNMQERIESLNGTFHIDSSIDNGTIIIANFPLIGMETENERK
ncbi:MAG: Oxygen sensor histidine kinase NreB [Ignavibacteriaceae bacterium]|nr:Oxygen sensor histidine kinase NreB [Ignavibacteriaceae bacterium]